MREIVEEFEQECMLFLRLEGDPIQAVELDEGEIFLFLTRDVGCGEERLAKMD